PTRTLGHTPRPLQDLPTLYLKWSYVPDTSACLDPPTQDDPKPLQMHQYELEAIGTCQWRKHLAISLMIRTLLSYSHLCTLLTTIDALRGPEREDSEALQRAFGVNIRFLENHDDTEVLDEDTRPFMALAEAVEGAVSWVCIAIQCLSTM
ncbi:hypothetical protein OG21DRAFT_1411895, partial [Imleria badia]